MCVGLRVLDKMANLQKEIETLYEEMGELKAEAKVARVSKKLRGCTLTICMGTLDCPRTFFS